MPDFPTLEDRIQRGIAAQAVTNDEIIPFDGSWDEQSLGSCLRRGKAKSEIFERLNSGWETTLYRYRSPASAVVMIVLRLDDPTREHKFIRPLRVERLAGIRPDIVALGLAPLRPLYGLDRLAASPEAEVLFVEGEKAADAGQSLFPDLVVMTWPNGAQGISQADFRPLAGRRATIWPDNDDAGRNAVSALAKQLTNAGAASIKIVSNPLWFPLKWDLADPVPATPHG